MAENQYTGLILLTRTRELHSVPDQSCYKSIPTPKCVIRKIRHIRLNAVELQYLVFGVML